MQRKSRTGQVVALAAVLLPLTYATAQLSSPGWRNGQAERVDPGQLLATMEAQTTGGSIAMGIEGVSPEVAELARGLQYDPVQIFNYVHNHIEYAPYFGLLKGAGQTLLERSGNDFDQCALLVELLKESGYAPVFVYGTMHIPMWDVNFYDLPNWLVTQMFDPAVESILANGGIPYVASEQVQGYEVDRVWVEVEIEGQMRKLDPAFKRHYGEKGVALQRMLGYSRTALLSEASGQTGSDYVQNLNQADLFTYLDGLTTNLLSSLASDHPHASVDEILGDIGVNPETVTNLPSTLRFASSTVATWTNVPNSYAHWITITHSNMPSITKKTHEIAGRRLSITYSPYVAAMAAAIGSGPVSLPGDTEAVELNDRAGTTNVIITAVTPPVVTNELNSLPLVLPSLEGNQAAIAAANFSVIEFEKIGVQTVVNWSDTWGIGGSGFVEYWVRFENASSAFSSTNAYGVFTLPAGESFVVGVQFSGVGQGHGIKTGLFKISWRAGRGGWKSGRTWDLTGEVAKSPEIWFSGESSVDTNVDVPSNTTLNFHNSGSEGLIINDYMTMSEGTPERFSFISGYVPFTMPQFSARHIRWSFDAAQHGQFDTKLDFNFTYDNMIYDLSSFWDVSFLGNARYVPDLTGSFGLNFGSNWHGIANEGNGIFKNNGLASLDITGISLIDSEPGLFQILSGDEIGTLDIGAERQIQVRYEANEVGSHTNTIRVEFIYDGRPFYYDLGLTGSTLAGELATLWLDDDILATETGPVSGASADLVIDIDHPYVANTNSYADAQVTYPLQRGATYTLVHGFGGTQTGLPLERRQRQLEAYREQGLLDDSREVMTESLNIIGQGWIEQTALASDLINRLAGVRQVMHHRFGLMAQEHGYYVDVRAQFGAGGSAIGNWVDTSAAFKAVSLVESAMEHGILEQMQGTDKPGASTIKLVTLANAEGGKIYLADSNNYTAIQGSLVDYSIEELAEFSNFIDAGGVLVLPEDGSLTLNEWTGKGYIGQGTQDSNIDIIQLVIQGKYGTQNGGFASYQGDLNIQNAYDEAVFNLYEEAERNDSVSHDPVNLATGDLLFDHIDLALSGSGVRGLSLSRHYTSANRNQDGPLGFGWTHAYHLSVTEHTQYKASLGERTPSDAAPMLVAGLVTLDLLKNEQDARGWVASSLVNQWAMDCLTENAVSVSIGPRILTYIEQPDGSYTPPPGVTTDLVISNGLYSLVERFGTEYRFNAEKRLASIVDSDANSLALTYHTQTNLETITDNYDRGLTFTYTDERITQVSDSTGRQISYGYTGGDLTSYMDPDGHIWTYSYDDAHRLTAIFDPLSQMTATNVYDALGRVKTQTNGRGNTWDFRFTDFINKEIDPKGGERVYYFDAKRRETGQELTPGQRTFLVYDGQDQVTRHWDANENLTQNQYDRDHNLTNRVDALGNEWRYDYDADHHLIAETDPLNHTTTYGYDARHHLTNTVDAMNNRTVHTYYTTGPHKGLLHTTTDPNNNLTTLTYDSNGNTLTLARTDGGTITNTSNARGDLLGTADANGHPTTSIYNNRRQLVSVTDALGNTISNVYDAAGLKTQSFDQLNRVTTTTWTPMYKVETITFPDATVVSNRYDSRDLLVAVIDVRGNTTSNLYDTARRKVVEIDALGGRTDFVLDPNGNVIAQTNALGHVSTFVYDKLDRLVMTSDPLNNTINNTSDAAGRLIEVNDEIGYRTKFGYDAANRRTAITKADGTTKRFNFDANGNLTTFYNGLGAPLTFAYDGMNRVTNEVNAAANSRNFVFDPTGNLKERHLADGAVIKYDYDDLNRLVDITYPDTSSVHYAYNELGLRTYQSNSVAEIRYGYDKMNRLSAVTQSVSSVQSVVRYQFDATGNRTNILYPGGVDMDYVFDAAGRLTHVTDWTGQTTQHTYDDAHRKIGTTFPNTTTSIWDWDNGSRLTRIRYANASSNFIDRIYAPDAHGNTTDMEVNAGLLPQVTPHVQRLQQNTADELTSIQTKANPSIPAWTDKTPLHDAEGNLTSNGDNTYTYDYENRLTSVQSASIETFYRYAGDGARMASEFIDTGSTNVTIYVIDYGDPLLRPLAELDSSGTLLRRFIWGSDLVAQVEADGTVHYFHQDGQGSTLALTGTSGATSDQWFYSPYGEVMARTGTTSTPYQWIGGHGVRTTDVGLYFMKARYYSTELRRFISADPIRLGGGPNLYFYANNNPIFFLDPFGLSATSRFDTRTDTIQGAQQILSEQHGPVFNFFADLMIGSIQRGVDTAFQAEQTGISPGAALTLGAIQSLGEASAVEASTTIGVVQGTAAAVNAAFPILESSSSSGPKIVDNITLSGGRSGSRVKNLTGPPNSAVKGNDGRVFSTNDKGQVILDITKDRVKPVTPGQGFGSKRPPTQQELDLINKLHRGGG